MEQDFHTPHIKFSLSLYLVITVIVNRLLTGKVAELLKTLFFALGKCVSEVKLDKTSQYMYIKSGKLN